MSLNYHLVDPLEDDEKDEQQSDVLDRFWAEKLDKKCQILPTAFSYNQPRMMSNAAMIPNDPQMSLNYHLVDPLEDDEKDEQQSDVLDGC
jgi:hypothetical protein